MEGSKLGEVERFSSNGDEHVRRVTVERRRRKLLGREDVFGGTLRRVEDVRGRSEDGAWGTHDEVTKDGNDEDSRSTEEPDKHAVE
jgi:hypothetical protein